MTDNPNYHSHYLATALRVAATNPDDAGALQTLRHLAPHAAAALDAPTPTGVRKMELTVLCTGLAEAVAKDEAPGVGGFDLSAGMFGPHVSEWLRGIVRELHRRAATPTEPKP